MRNVVRRSRPDAGAAGDLATAESPPERRERSRVSRDGRWWWDGTRWVATTTPDGLWRWDGGRWQPTIELAGARPWDLTTSLTLLAEDRYARAALILVERAGEWGPEGEVRHLVEQAARLRRPLRRPARALAGPGGAGDLPGLLRRLRGRTHDVQRLHEDRALLDTERRAVLVRLGRAAPSPTVKEADELLHVAQLLDGWVAALSRALAAVDEAERSRARAIGAAQRAAEEAEERRRSALAAAQRALEEAEVRRAEARRAAGERLHEALAPASGVPLARVGPLRACPAAVETPAGRLPAASVRARVDTAAALWAERRDLLEDLLVLGTPDGDAFLGALAERPDDHFVLLEARSRVVLWPCPTAEEEPARAFADAVRRHARRAARRAGERGAAIREAEAAASAVASMTDEAWAREALERLEADPELRQQVEEARERLARAREDPPELVTARRQVADAIQALTIPPASLAPAPVERAG